MARVDLWFDFVSPYSYLGVFNAVEFGRTHGIEWRPRPVVYAALLDSTGLVGPAEVESKRRYTFADIRRAAALSSAPLSGPPEHPFRSLEALRIVCLFLDSARCMDLTVELAVSCWGRGCDLTDPDVRAAAVRAVGLDDTDLPTRIAAAEVKTKLRELTTTALQRGVFGVPTYDLDGELFWGHDRLEHLGARLQGRIADGRQGLERILSRPRGADRPRSPNTGS